MPNRGPASDLNALPDYVSNRNLAMQLQHPSTCFLLLQNLNARGVITNVLIRSTSRTQAAKRSFVSVLPVVIGQSSKTRIQLLVASDSGANVCMTIFTAPRFLDRKSGKRLGSGVQRVQGARMQVTKLRCPDGGRFLRKQ
eukprot:CAMPEP_0204406864 /NCGR_PEP_ID=MMETSP0470-20130426/8349_1 /ASSEMBLY_ACC=CAM_ASM_000385 /TAXON_ID=2969 /ORGANISM="Oxyrrhis marina" /LENGTH=139 /DNA_ID=CAMNT_0051402471 /DNA_START=67 /DNA_END=486 /DNA_ORIENTATION=+